MCPKFIQLFPSEAGQQLANVERVITGILQDQTHKFNIKHQSSKILIPVFPLRKMICEVAKDGLSEYWRCDATL